MLESLQLTNNAQKDIEIQRKILQVLEFLQNDQRISE